ncbi:head GIN domain-containing protein [Flaviaesturariibacter amylovorans]|uniref:Putative auto-transporter adhesin head GIN domain-containing protein n=1 Tax=Flaviaesturariibacter amylovorans TaxID=1084520 RepID=A0ABP8HJT7_9BACT
MRILVATALSVLSLGAAAQDNETITGNGKTVTADVPVKSFDALKASGVYELKLAQGSAESVKIEADENLQALFEVRNEGSQLVIDMKKRKGGLNLKKGSRMTVYVTFRQLKRLELNMVGNVRTEGQLTFNDINLKNNSVGNVDLKLSADRIDVDNDGVGNVVLSGKATNAVFHHDGVGALRAGDLQAQSVSIDNDGVGGAEVNAEKELKVKDSFLGKVKNRGAARMHKKEVI